MDVFIASLVESTKHFHGNKSEVRKIKKKISIQVDSTFSRYWDYVLFFMVSTPRTNTYYMLKKGSQQQFLSLIKTQTKTKYMNKLYSSVSAVKEI